MLEDKVTLPPAQKFVEPPAVITGVDGKVFTVMTVATDEALWQPLEFATFTV
jgi:hypothetical protein